MAVHDQIVKAISELESRPIRTRRDITYMEGEAKILLTLKEMSTARPKFSHDHEFQNTVLSILELQKEYGSASDHIRASQIFVELRKRMQRTQVTRGQFFYKLYEIFPPTIGSSNAETGPDLVEVAYQASFPRDNAPRAGIRKENVNPQSGKRKTTFDEPSAELKLLQDLKSENGNIQDPCGAGELEGTARQIQEIDPEIEGCCFDAKTPHCPGEFIRIGILE